MQPPGQPIPPAVEGDAPCVGTAFRSSPERAGVCRALPKPQRGADHERNSSKGHLYQHMERHLPVPSATANPFDLQSCGTSEQQLQTGSGRCARSSARCSRRTRETHQAPVSKSTEYLRAERNVVYAPTDHCCLNHPPPHPPTPPRSKTLERLFCPYPSTINPR